jgi:hypothetical protein
MLLAYNRVFPMIEKRKNKSTGPRTEQGKAAASQNALKHGLASGKLIVHDEDPAEFEALLAALIEDYEPANTIESMLVHDIAKFHWLKERSIRLYQRSFFETDAYNHLDLPLLIRYQTTSHRAFLNAVKTLQAVQKERLKREGEFVSQTDEYYGGPYFGPTGMMTRSAYFDYVKSLENRLGELFPEKLA